jgi:signal transduction histidine kinase/TolA-binding protein
LTRFTFTFLGNTFLKLPVYDIIFYKSKKAFLLIIALTFTWCLSFAQQEKIDSLKTAVENSSGIEKFEPIIGLVRVYGAGDNKTALQYAKEAKQLAYEFGDSAKIVMSSRMIGQLYNRLSMNKEAEEILLSSLPIAERNNIRTEYKAMLSNLAIAYTYQAKYDKALDIHFKTLALREADKDLEEITLSLNNIGVVYFKLKNYERALEFYQRALELKKRIKDNYDLDRLLINTALCYNQLNDFIKAQEYFALGFKECGDNCREQIKIDGQFGLGVSYFGMHKYEDAEKHFNESFLLAQKSGDKRFQAENLVYLGKIAISKGETNKAETVLKEAEVLANGSGYNQLLMDSYKQFSILYNQVKDFEKAALYQNKYISLKDSLIGEDLVKNIAKIQTSFEERENIKTIADKDEVIQRQRGLNLAIVIIAVLATLLIFVLYRSNQVKKKVNAALSEAKSIIEDQNRQLLNSNYNLDKELKVKNADLEKANESLRRVNDELDNFIYKTSHDIRGPLASLKGMCNVALMDVKDQLALGYLKKLDITAEKLNTILTRLLIVNQINNSTLGADKIDFASIVSDVLMLEKKKGLPARLKISKSIDDNIEFYSDKEFVRIILENLIDNAIKFYNDSDRIEPFVSISVTNDGDYVKIKVVDNGIGISEVHPDKIFQMFSRASERSETGGIGLYITKTAAEKLGGSVNLKTTPEGYTEFYALLPFSMNKVLV